MFVKTKNFGKNLLVYEGKYDDAYGLFIKITDYKKGYWAETPLEKSELEELVAHLKNYLKAVKRLER